RLTQKYGPTFADVLATRDRSTRELELLDTADFDLRAIGGQRENAAAEFARACAALTAKRAQGAERLAQAVNEVLPALGMAGGRGVGQALAAVARGGARGRQVLVITHLPQIAVYADHHLVVQKGARSGIATSDVQVLAGEARTREVARLLGDRDSASALRHAT